MLKASKSAKPKRFHKPAGRKATKQPMSKTLSYHIEHMDPLGQGVAKQNSAVTFIGKTLPGETLTAQVVSSKKGVSFAQLKQVEEPALNRIPASCEHYDQCPGCHYLHTDYHSELGYKKQALAKLLAKLAVSEEDIQVIAAPKRDGYRNRIQLHYRGNSIGLVDGMTDKIVEIPHCQIIQQEIKPALTALYQDRSWSKGRSRQGHCELYLKNEVVNVEWNERYAHGGFTQVFAAMNEQLCARVTEYIQREAVESVLDLFAGDGNLTEDMCADGQVKRIMVDYSADNHRDNFFPLDLFAEDALKKFQSKCKDKHFDALIVDPPRKGFSALSQWVKKYKPKLLVYVSCNAATMARDLANLSTPFTMETVELLDLFPSTYHFETISFVRFK
ncbi:hypothetical protein QX776_10090 [Alteromonadaceae bacterium BrNp21-10]|nr:hypothetical protein [Alteromonadaceae bacterium BrNp21-10]